MIRRDCRKTHRILMRNSQLLTATLKIAGTLQKSAEVMNLVNQLVKLPEIAKTMQEMSMEMTRVRTGIQSPVGFKIIILYQQAGIIDEMIGDTFEMMDDEDLEEEADEEVNKVLYQVTEGKSLPFLHLLNDFDKYLIGCVNRNDGRGIVCGKSAEPTRHGRRRGRRRTRVGYDAKATRGTLSVIALQMVM
jgi:hypothetical protein